MYCYIPPGYSNIEIAMIIGLIIDSMPKHNSLHEYEFLWIISYNYMKSHQLEFWHKEIGISASYRSIRIFLIN